MSWWQSLGLPGTQIDPSKMQFPIELELVPELLRAHISLCNFKMGDEELSCWTYSTEGLAKTGQKEILLAIKKQAQDKISDFPQAPLEFFKSILQHAMSREFIEAGSISDFGSEGFLSSRFTGAAYIRSQPMGDWFPPADSLSVVLLTQEELQAAQIAGLVRVLSLLGKAYLHYPCPVWNDLSRPSIISEEALAQMAQSFISQMPRMLVRGSGVFASEQVIDLQLPLSARHYFKQLADLSEESPLLLLCDLDERADAILVWQQEKKDSPLAVSAPGAKGTRICGSFLCFAPAQTSDHGMIIEDGFALSLRKESWQELKQSLINGSPFYLARQEDAYDFRLNWYQDENPDAGPETIQIKGVDPICRGDSNFDPEVKISVSAYAKKISLLTHEAEIRELIDNETLRRFITHVEDLIRDHFAAMGESEGFDLSVVCSILPENKVEFEVSSNPIMEADDESYLIDRLMLTYSPGIDAGQIKFQMELSVWGGKENSLG